MRTTDLEKLKNSQEPFTWGRIIHIQEIGPYAIASFHPWQVNGSTVLTGQPNKDEIHYHTWVDGKDCHSSYNSLDEALAACIAYRAEGPNHRANYYFINSIRPEQKRTEKEADEIALKYWNEHGKGETDGKAYKALVSILKD